MLYNPIVYEIQQIYYNVLYWLGVLIIIGTILCVLYGFFYSLFYYV